MLSLYINNNEGSYKKVNQRGNEVNVQLQPPILLDKNKNYRLLILYIVNQISHLQIINSFINTIIYGTQKHFQREYMV